jgi:hypothetical protein
MACTGASSSVISSMILRMRRLTFSRALRCASRPR